MRASVAELKLKPVVLNVGVAGERTNSQKLSSLSLGPSLATAPRWSGASLGGAGGITSEVCALSPSTGTSSLCSRTRVFSRAVLISHSCPGQLCVHWSWDRSSLVRLSRSRAHCCQACWKAGSSRRSLTEGFCSHTACLLARCPQPLLAVLCAINRFPCRTRRRCCPTAP